MEVKKLGKDTYRHIETENLSIWITEMQDDSFRIECAVLFVKEYVVADSIEDAQKAGLIIIEKRINWLMKLWLREIRQLTEQTEELAKEMTDAKT